jgi:hypothetical protein
MKTFSPFLTGGVPHLQDIFPAKGVVKDWSCGGVAADFSPLTRTRSKRPATAAPQPFNYPTLLCRLPLRGPSQGNDSRRSELRFKRKLKGRPPGGATHGDGVRAESGQDLALSVPLSREGILVKFGAVNSHSSAQRFNGKASWKHDRCRDRWRTCRIDGRSGTDGSRLPANRPGKGGACRWNCPD